jgi:RNA polymerase sigma-70 factor (ECF subfamily)
VLQAGILYHHVVDLAQTQRLITRALDGGDMERARLLEHLGPRLTLWAGSRLSPALRAKLEPEDVAQETLFAIHKSLDTFTGKDGRAFMAWVFRIAENRIRDLADHFGAKKRQPIVPLSFTQTSPSTVVSRHEEVERVLAVLPELPDDYREVMRLRRFEDRDVKEIAEIMSRSPNAVRVLYCRALRALKEAMERQEHPS